MSGYRLPGPLCGESLTGSLLDGTLALWRTPLPGPVCVASSRYRSSALQAIEPAQDLSHLFHQCLNPVRGISDDNYAASASVLDTDVATIKAVAEVETSGSAFDDFGRPRILFERHYFHRLTSGRFSAAHRRISARSSGGYGKFSAQYGKLEEAYLLDAEAALRSASWGRFQIMGDNFIAAGFGSVRSFVVAMSRSEAAHLKAFVHFVKGKQSMARALRDKEWARFARGYNGKDYRKNAYDTKLQLAYERFHREATRPSRPNVSTERRDP